VPDVSCLRPQGKSALVIPAVENGMRGGRSGWRARCHTAQAAQIELA
jgi:hypothetical protein